MGVGERRLEAEGDPGLPPGPAAALGAGEGWGVGGGELQHVGAEGRREEDAGPERRRRELVRPVAAGLGCLGEALGFAGGPSPGLGGQAREAVV